MNDLSLVWQTLAALSCRTITKKWTRDELETHLAIHPGYYADLLTCLLLWDIVLIPYRLAA